MTVHPKQSGFTPLLKSSALVSLSMPFLRIHIEPCPDGCDSAIKSSSRAGFTLIETLLYVSISAVLLLAVSGLVHTVLSSRVKSQTVAEVELQGAQVMQALTQAVRNAKSITAPGAGLSADILTLLPADAADDPVVFDVSDFALRIAEGGGSPVSLTSSRVAVSDVVFENFTSADTPGTVRIRFTLSRNNDTDRNEYEYSQSFYGSATIR